MSAASRHLGTSAIVAFAVAALAACGSSDLLVGDDSRDAIDGATVDTSFVLPDGATSNDATNDAATNDAAIDADVSCPLPTPPAPGFCDGGPIAPKFSTNGCTNGYACAPIACTGAGGSCVGLAPGSCVTNHIGDASKYSCGGSSACCLP